MHDLVAMTPLGGSDPRVDRHGGVTLTEVCGVPLASVEARLGQEQAAAALVASVTGEVAPGPGRASARAVWTGPDQWLVEARAEDLVSGAVSVTDQTDGWCRFDVTGDRLADVFERLCAVDLRGWSGGQATRTAIEHLGCLVICRAAGHVTVLGPRSSAGSLHHALWGAMLSAL